MKRMTARLFSMAVGLNAVSKAAKASASKEQETDVLLIGGGIMSATLGTWLQDLEPDWSITMVERLDALAEESSNGWNNAGTGHAALMELNYTPRALTARSALKKRLKSTKRSVFLASSGRIRSKPVCCANRAHLLTPYRI